MKAIKVRIGISQRQNQNSRLTSFGRILLIEYIEILPTFLLAKAIGYEEFQVHKANFGDKHNNVLV